MEKDFFDVFPHLKVKKELEELLDMVFVTKVSMNPGRTHLRFILKAAAGYTRRIFLRWRMRSNGSAFRGFP